MPPAPALVFAERFVISGLHCSSACLPLHGPELGGGDPEAHILGGELKPSGGVAPCFRAPGDLSVLVNGSFRARVPFWTLSPVLFPQL